MKHIIKVTATINQTLKEIEDIRHSTEVGSEEWIALTDEIHILRRVGDHLEDMKKRYTKYSKTLGQLNNHRKNCSRCSFIPTREEEKIECLIENDILHKLNKFREEVYD